MWELTSGKKELLEEAESCLLGEVKNKTGLDIKIFISFSVFDCQIEKSKKKKDILPK